MIIWPDLSFGPINLWSVPKMNDEPNGEAFYTPEGCEECGCEACEFGEGERNSGHWSCPECGAVC